MAGATMTTADAVLKEDYLDTVREQLNQKTKFLSQIDKNTDDVSGKEAYLALHTTRNSGVGARAEGGTLPTAGQQGTAAEKVPLKHNYLRIQVSGPVKRAARTDRTSYIRAVDFEMKQGVQDLQRDLNRQAQGTSDGVIATAGTTTTSATIQLLAATTATQMRQFEIGMVVDVGTVAAPTTIASARTITAIDAANKTITVSGATMSTVSGTHFVFRSGSGGQQTLQGQTTGLEITGLQTIVAASGTLFAVDPSTVPSWASTVDSSGGQATDAFLQKLADTVELVGSGSIKLFVTSFGVSRSLANYVGARQRIVNSVALKAGWSGIAVQLGDREVAVAADRDTPEGRLYGLDTDHLVEFVGSDYEWADDDGAILSRVSGVDAFEAYMYRDHELATDERNAHVVATGLTEF